MVSVAEHAARALFAETLFQIGHCSIGLYNPFDCPLLHVVEKTP
jgi:hypothetical protein